MTNIHRLHTLALLTGGQKRAVKNCHLVPKIIFALKYPEKHNKKLYLVGDYRIKIYKAINVQLSSSLSNSPQSIRTCSILTEKVICFSPTCNRPTLQYYKKHVTYVTDLSTGFVGVTL